MIGLIWLVYYICSRDNTREPGIKNSQGFFPVAVGNFLFEPAQRGVNFLFEPARVWLPPNRNHGL